MEAAGSSPARPTMLGGYPLSWVSGGWGVLGVALRVWGVFLVCFWFCLVLSGYCSATVLLDGWACALWWVGAGCWRVFPCVGAVFLVCISAPFGMNGVVSGAFSGSFRFGGVFSGSDA